jgi:hypothetical protein
MRWRLRVAQYGVELLYVDRTELLDGHLTDVGREVLR